MRKSHCTVVIELLKETIYQYDFFIKGYKQKNNVKIAAQLCDSLPFEIIYAAGYTPLRVPSFLFTKDCCSSFNNKKSNFGDLFDLIILPEGCVNRNFYEKQNAAVVTYRNPPGYGDDFSHKIDKEIKRLFNNTEIDQKQLKNATEMYNIIRRQIRRITAQRKINPGIISCSELNIIFEAAMILPPEIVNDHLNKIIDIISNLNDESEKPSGDLINSFLYTSFTGHEDLFDEIEETGFLIFEDDSCNGRRQFDISVNAESDQLYKEILHASSFKPYCPSKREVTERYELLYKLLKSHEAELVIFIEDLCCKSRKKQIDFLNVRLMRSGVDTIIVNSENAIDELKKYRENSLKTL